MGIRGRRLPFCLRLRSERNKFHSIDRIAAPYDDCCSGGPMDGRTDERSKKASRLPVSQVSQSVWPPGRVVAGGSATVDHRGDVTPRSLWRAGRLQVPSFLPGLASTTSKVVHSFSGLPNIGGQSVAPSRRSILSQENFGPRNAVEQHRGADEVRDFSDQCHGFGELEKFWKSRRKHSVSQTAGKVSLIHGWKCSR